MHRTGTGGCWRDVVPLLAAEAAGTWWRWQQRPPVENGALWTREMQILLPEMIGDFTSPSSLLVQQLSIAFPPLYKAYKH
jgi:hypothetical protein